MFKKTRNRIMLLNMVMASSVVLVVFAVIFITSYTVVQAENREKLNFSPSRASVGSVIIQGLPGGFHVPEGSHNDESIRIDNYGAQIAASIEQYFFSTVDWNEETWVSHGQWVIPRRVMPGEGVAFSVLVDGEGNIRDLDSWVDLSPEAIIRLSELASEDAGDKRAVLIDGRMWASVATPISVIQTEEVNDWGQRTITSESVTGGHYQSIRFVDVTESYEMLQSLALTLTAASIIVLAVFFFISRYFAAQAIKPMEEAWEKQRQFITDASHELKTPLSVINANCGVLYSNQDEPLNDQIRWVDSITRATDRMTGLVGSLLSLASMDDKQFELLSTSFDAGGEMMAAVSEMEVVADDKGITINKDIASDISIENDREQVHKILSTLLDNAVKYTPFNGEITVSVKKDKKHVIYAVRNSGPGIPKEELPRVFDRFYRGDPARSSDSSGFGLGLAIAKSIADKINAKLSVESIVDEYTEFKLVFEN